MFSLQKPGFITASTEFAAGRATLNSVLLVKQSRITKVNIYIYIFFKTSNLKMVMCVCTRICAHRNIHRGFICCYLFLHGVVLCGVVCGIMAGFTCDSFKEYNASKHCRFCQSQLPPSVSSSSYLLLVCIAN